MASDARLRELAGQVRMIDADAASWIRYDLRKSGLMNAMLDTHPMSLVYLFDWSRTPQGSQYWCDIHRELLDRGWYDQINS